MKQEPKTPREFRDTSDNPTNDGNGIESRDWDEIRPPAKVVGMYPEDEGEGIEDADSMQDLWDEYSNE